MANVKYADPTYTDIPPTDDDKVMFRTGAGGDARGSIVQPKGYIDGLRLEYVSPTQVRVTSGAAYVPGPKRIAELASAVTLTPTLAANTWYHSYLTVSGSTVSVEAVTTAPTAAYSGTARAKTGDTSRRYIGSFRTDAAGAIVNFMHANDSVTYRVDTSGAAFRVLAGGSATVATSVSCAAVVPITSQSASAVVTNQGAVGVRILESLGSYGVAGRLYGVGAGGFAAVPIPLNAAQEFQYYNTGAGGSVVVEITGYAFQR